MDLRFPVLYEPDTQNAARLRERLRIERSGQDSRAISVQRPVLFRGELLCNVSPRPFRCDQSRRAFSNSLTTSLTSSETGT